MTDMNRMLAAVIAMAPMVLCAMPKGDGVADDTAEIQKLLDQKGLVALEQPKAVYRISKTLKIHSDTELRLAPDARVLLAPNSDCPLLGNSDVANGNVRITVKGGIWDMDNTKQGPNAAWAHLANPPRPRANAFGKYVADFYRGNAFYFENIQGFRFEGAVIRNPVTYAFQMCRVCDFDVNGVTFDFTTENPIKGNMDGIHLDGGCHRGRIANLRGTCWDDMVAINADDGLCSASLDEISDVVIEDLKVDYCHSAVRLLSAPNPVRRIRIRNVEGRFYQYAIGFTHYFPERPQGIIEDILIEHVKVCKVPPPDPIPGFTPDGGLPTIFFDQRLKMNRVTFDDVTITPHETRRK